MPSALAISALGRSHLRHNRRNPPSIYAQGMRQLFPKLRLGPTIMHHALVFVRLAHDRRFVGAFLFALRRLRPLRFLQDLGAASCCP